jgi:hypothetical protein
MAVGITELPKISIHNSPVSPPLPLEKIPVNPHRLDAARVIRFWAVHQAAK